MIRFKYFFELPLFLRNVLLLKLIFVFILYALVPVTFVPVKAQESFLEVEKQELRTEYSKTFQTGFNTFRHEVSVIEDTNVDIGYNTLNAFGQGSLHVGGMSDERLCISGSCPTVFRGSISLLKFGVSLPTTANITGAQLVLHQFDAAKVTMPPLDIMVSKINGNWDEKSFWPGPSLEGDYGNIQLGYYRALTQISIRPITLNLKPELISELQKDNKGFALKPRYDLSSPGVNFCSAEGSYNFCVEKHRPKLTINYIVNTPPNTPELVSPSNNQVESGFCNESVNPPVGKCRNGLEVNATVKNIGDGDLGAGALKSTELSFIGPDSVVVPDIIGSGLINHTTKLNDGIYRWKARSLDGLGVWGEFSPELLFSIDTTPPQNLAINPLAQWTGGVGEDSSLQLEIRGQGATDNVSTNEEISYYLEYSQSETFTDKVFFKGWQKGTGVFQLGSFGADSKEGTEDDLKNENTYYFRIKAKDGAENISTWTPILRTTFDVIRPDITNLVIDNQRISPGNATSVEIKDLVSFDITFEELHPEDLTISVKNLREEVIYEKTQPLSIYDGGKTKVSWNGKNNIGSVVPDGAYYVDFTIRDSAGNTNKDKKKHIITVDNSGAKISISTPFDNAWINTNEVAIKGQVTFPNVPDKEDGDIAKLELIGEQNKSIEYDEFGIFETKVLVDNVEKTFTLRSEDTVGNREEKKITIRTEQNKPSVSFLSPSAVTSDLRPEVMFKTSDADSGIFTGSNPKGFTISLEYIQYDGVFERIIQKKLIEDGVNLDNSFVEDVVCQHDGIIIKYYDLDTTQSTSCTLKFISNLIPNLEYSLVLSVSDVAGNVHKDTRKFLIDTEIVHEITKPISNGIYNNSSVLIAGKTSKGADLIIKNATTGEFREFILTEKLHNSGKEEGLTAFITSDFRIFCEEQSVTSGMYADEICTWEVNVQSAFVNTDISTFNTLVISAKDLAGNLKVKQVEYYVNIFSFETTITSDIDRFSPNSDGNQDAITFNHEIQPNGTQDQPIIKQYSLRIFDQTQTLKREFSGVDVLPLQTIWDGTICKTLTDCELVVAPDGAYAYSLFIQTRDGVEIETEKKILFIKTNLDRETVITYPKNNFITARGVINVQGQAPVSKSTVFDQVKVRICLKEQAQQFDQTCLISTDVDVSDKGYFGSLIALENTNISEQKYYVVSAHAYDNYGNKTPISNTITVIKDSIKAIKNVQIRPALTGVTNEEDYLKFLRGEVSIDQIRTVNLVTDITQHTEQLELSFGDKVALQQYKEESIYKLIGTVTDKTERNKLLNPYELSQVKELSINPLGHQSIASAPCLQAVGCEWEHMLPINSNFGGVYEVRFRTKKGENIEEAFAGFRADGTLPAAPNIMIVEKWDTFSSEWVAIEKYSGTHFTNNSRLRFRGAAEPGALLQFRTPEKSFNIFKANQSGVWEQEFDMYQDMKCTQRSESACTLGNITLNLFAFEGEEDNKINEVPALNPLSIRYDTVQPSLAIVTRSTNSQTIAGWAKNGDEVFYKIQSSEDLRYVDIVKPDNYTQLLRQQSNPTEWYGNILISTNDEGYYSPTIRLIDLAGNKKIFNASDYESHGLSDWRVYIDNTKPNASEIDTQGWGADSGIKADGIYPETGRLNPYYVIKSNTVKINGFAEKYQRVRIFVNSTQYTILNVSDTNCKSQSRDTSTGNGLLVKSGTVCFWEFSYNFTGKGRNNQFGVPLESYMFQVQVLDRAANVSALSKEKIVYYDTVSPVLPTISNLNNISSSKDNTTNQLAIGVTAVGERYSDTELWSSHTQKVSLKDYKTGQSDALGKIDRSLNLGTISDSEAPNCIENLDGKRTGICQDGVYRITVRSTDAAGNAGAMREVYVVRDTVAPEKPVVTEPKLCEEYICVDVSGETGTLITSSGNASGVTSQPKNTIKTIRNWKYGETYTIRVSLQDHSGNTSEETTLIYRTPDPSLFQGGIPGVDDTNPFGKITSSVDTTLNVFMHYGKNTFDIKSIAIPTPQLTLVSTREDNKADTYGVGISKENAVSSKITVQYMTFNQAKEHCGVFIFPDTEEIACMERAMGINSLYQWNQQALADCYYAIPVISQSCVLELQKIRFNIYDKGTYRTALTDAPKIAIHKDNAHNTKLDELWNVDKEGKFTRTLNIPDHISVGEWQKARATVSGHFDYEGTLIKFNGESDWSNKLQVDKSEYINVQGTQAKVLPVPYFNQYLEADGKTYNPKGGWYMCGAASSVMVAGYFGKLPYDKNNEFSLKKYMYTDSGQGITKTCGPDAGGAFGLTNYQCNQSWTFGIVQYLKHHKLKYEFISGRDSVSGNYVGDLTFENIKKQIDMDRPIILSYQQPNFGHIFVVIGYTADGKIVVNDPYKDFINDKKGSFNFSGRKAVYTLDKDFKYYTKASIAVSQ